jgi:hypothetical protein
LETTIDAKPIDIKEVNREGFEHNEKLEKQKAGAMFNKKLDELRDTGFTDIEILTQLNIDSFNRVLLADSKTIYAALECLHDADQR